MSLQQKKGSEGESDLAFMSPREKRDLVWNQLLEKKLGKQGSTTLRQWPSYNDVLNDVRKSDYNDILTCPHDIHPAETIAGSKTKTICPLGVVCCAKLELFPFPEDRSGGIIPYTGLLSPGTNNECCLLRLSSALQSTGGGNRRMARLLFGPKLTNAKIFPAVVLKVFRRNPADSANALFLGSKTGQVEDDFFAHCVSTQLTSRMAPTLTPILRIFKRYSDHPLALGLSNCCSCSAGNGEACDGVNFPYCLTLQPCIDKFGGRSGNGGQKAVPGTPRYQATKDGDDAFLDDLRSIPPQSIIYNVFASPDPVSVTDPSKLQRIGRIVTTSEMIDSHDDDGLFFRHQNKDEDFLLRPEWKSDLKTKVTMKDGSKGTSQSLAGWELFEEQIESGTYRDFESGMK